ncbi:hypothetical protein QBC34DRAFT_160696 [Podospora aff. communis PSN243]|uniref:NAD-dependent epimerase/dehydratase domain-containing protein n=1 Tax=Podospora aff. communis PSN243 TaxID=3040156 RepID=A0AAV9GBE9_9PEZI|nr:hypothetical protein QBC34DRAFT_160696 [Podospora aff. communis PSN243]
MPTSNPAKITNPLLPPSSLILVTGANGLIASHVTDQLLAHGYRVRGTVRSISRCSYLTDLYTARHGHPSRFSLHEVPDVSAPGAWDDTVKGVSAIAHVLGATDLGVQDADESAAEELKWQVELLEAARRTGTVESFVFTSSAWAAWTPGTKQSVKLTEDSWNEEAVELARDKSVSAEAKGLAGFMALKTLVEKGVWEWVRREKPEFAFNAILPDTVMGECLDPKNQGIPSTAGMVQWVWENKYVDVLDMMRPQWHVDCRDTGLLYVAVLVTSPKVDRERIYAFGDRYSWFKVAEILGRVYPDHREQLAKVKNTGWDDTQVPVERGEELLRRVGQDGWTKLEESVKQNAKSWLKLEKQGVTAHKYGVEASRGG